MALDPQLVKTISIVGGVLFFIAVIAGLTLYTSSSKDTVPNDKPSKDKMTALNEALRSALGYNWPYVLLVFVLVLGLAMAGFYMASMSGGISINLGDVGASRFNLILSIFVALFAVFIIIVGVKDYLNYRQQQNNPDIPNYVPSETSQTQNTKILEIVALGLFVLVGGGFAAWYLFTR